MTENTKKASDNTAQDRSIAYRDGTLTVPITRRQLMARGGKLTALAAMMSAAGVSFVACGDDSDDRDEDEAPPAAADETPEEDAVSPDEPTAEETPESPEDTDDGNATSGGTLTIVRSTDPLNLHPGVNSGLADIATNFLVYDALVLHGFDGEIYPALAESWEFNEDGTVWTFKLREDVTFHSGEQFTAEHVVDHFNRWKDMPTSAKIALLESVEAEDDYTVVFTLSSSTLVFLNNISQTEWAYASIPNANLVAELGNDYGVTDIDGTGPYRMEEWVKDDHITLVRNEDYTWGSVAYENLGPAYPERIIFRVVPEEASRTALLETGDANLNIEVAPRDVGRLEDTPGISVSAFPRLSSNHIGFNMERDLFQDVNVRKAVMHAVNREEITQFVMQGQADPAEGYLHPQANGANPRDVTRPLVEYNPERSEELLEESGWEMGSNGIREKDGQQLSFTLYLTTELNEQINQAVQDQLRQVGIDMQINRLESAGFSDATNAGEHDARFIPMIYSTADHMYFFVSDAIPSPNTIRWSDAHFDELFDRSQTTTDMDERNEIFAEMEMYLLEQAVVVPVQHLTWIFGWDDTVKGTTFHNVHGIYKLMDTWIES